MFTSGNTSPCHHSLHLFVKTDESQQAGIVQKLSDQALTGAHATNASTGCISVCPHVPTRLITRQ
ncbi:hypothetical protein CFR80_16470 [Komagataeibacter oboediens]|uniref:Uncharacterized protein n=1 Tax=Komagataeibacter oboediens TaxID=65958 RepID=A0A318QFS7_9PROT|nr:hypothetical protein CFR80_16470 [Komagataeibacter oboediens]